MKTTDFELQLRNLRILTQKSVDSDLEQWIEI